MRSCCQPARREDEVSERDRYKIFKPSIALTEFAKWQLRLDIKGILRGIVDIGIEVFETERFVYIIGIAKSFIVIAVTSCLLSHLNASVPATFRAQLSQNGRNGADFALSLHFAKVRVDGSNPFARSIFRSYFNNLRNCLRRYFASLVIIL